MANNQINASVGLDTRDLQFGVSSALGDLTKLGGGLGSLARQLQRQQQALTMTADEMLAHRIETARMSDAQRNALRNAHLWNQTLAHTQAAEKAAAEAENKRKQGIDNLLGSLNREVAALGKTNAQLQINELRSLGATQAQIRQAQAAQNLIAAHERLNRVSSGGGGFGVGGTLAMAGGGAGLIQTLDSWTAFQNRLKLVHSSSQDVATAQEGILKIAKETGANLGQVGTVYQRFAQNQRALGLTIQDSLELTDTVSKAIAISGVSAESSGAALAQFGQALASGVLRGEEFNSVMEQAPGLAQALARGLDVNLGKLRQMANNGQLSTDVLIRALKTASKSINDDFGKTTMTIGESLEIAKTHLAAFVGTANDGTNAVNLIGGAIRGAAKHVDVLAVGLGALAAVKLGVWAVTSAASVAQNTAALIAMRGAAATATAANTANAAAISRTGTAASIAAMQVTGFAGAVQVLGVSARTTTASLMALNLRMPAMGGAAPIAAAGIAAVTTSLTALFAAIDVARGKSGDNWISNLANDAADAVGIIDKRTESLGTKLFDRWQVQGQAARDFIGVVNPVAKIFLDWVKPLKKSTDELSKQAALVEAIQAKSGYAAVSTKIDTAGGIEQFKAANLPLEKLQASLAETVVKYKEQSAEIGKNKEELALLRLETEKQVLLKKQQAEFEDKFRGQANKDELVAESMRRSAEQIELDFQAAKSAISEFTKKTAEAKVAEEAKTEALRKATEMQERNNRVNETLKEMQIELSKVGKSAKEIKLIDLKNAGATTAQLAKAKSILDLQELREKQFADVGKSIETAAQSFQAAVDTEKSYIETQAAIMRQQADEYNKKRELEAQAAREKHVSEQGGLTNDQWRAFSLAKYGHEWFAKIPEYQRAYTGEQKKSLDQMVQAAVEMAEQSKQMAAPQTATPQTAANDENLFSQAVGNFQAAVTTFSQTLSQQNAKSMQKVSLDLTLPDGKKLTSILFAEPEFINKLRTASVQNMYNQVGKHAMAVS